MRLPWEKPPQSLNDRQNHHVKAKATAEAKNQARWALRAEKIQLPDLPIYLVLHQRLGSNQRRDASNLGQTLKVVEDALVLETDLPDDSWKYVRATGQSIHPPDPGFLPGLWLEIGSFDGARSFLEGQRVAPEIRCPNCFTQIDS